MNPEEHSKILDEHLLRRSKEKFILYETAITSYDGPSDEYGNFTSPGNVRIDSYFLKINNNYKFDPKFTFNYYFLIKETIYKKFKKLISYDTLLRGSFGITIYFFNKNNDYMQSYCEIFKNITKFFKPHYNKDFFNFNGNRYVKIKVRSVNNTFVSNIILVCDIDYNKYMSLYGNDSFLFMAVPVKKTYINLITPTNFDPYSGHYNTSFELNSKITLYLNVLIQHKRLVEKTIEYIKNDEKIVFTKNYYNLQCWGFIENNETGNKSYICLILPILLSEFNDLVSESYFESLNRKIN